MKKTDQIGLKGELLAQNFLKDKGFNILHTNWRYKRSEIDIIAQLEKIIVFVEVKTRNNIQFGMPEDFVNRHKIKKMQEAADAYIEQLDWKGELRFDIIAIEKNNIIKHFEDAFYS